MFPAAKRPADGGPVTATGIARRGEFGDESTPTSPAATVAPAAKGKALKKS